MNKRKRFQELTIRDNFMFAAVMMFNDNCKKFLEMLLKIEIKKIVIGYEKSLIYNPECKGVRLDVYANDENNTRYDIEMQVAEQELGKRTRYYHSQMDMDILESGHEYRELPAAYVIFVCNFDPFKKGKYCYTFENRCIEDLSMSMGDESRSIFLSTEGKDVEGIPEELLAFLKFVKEDTPENDTKTENAYIKELQWSIRRVKENRELERSFMSLEDIRKAGKVEGIREAVLELLGELGEVPSAIRCRIMSENDIMLLKTMLKMAKRAKDFNDLEQELTNLQ